MAEQPSEMFDRLVAFIKGLKANPKVRSYNEDKTKQAITLPMLDILEWTWRDVDEVTPEFAVEKGQVDYSLRLNNVNRVFIEVKKPGENLENHQKQLLDYSFHHGVELAILTNGITWWFYLPTQKGDWKTRKFCTINITHEEPEYTASNFAKFLSRNNVQSGEALRHAESIHKSHVKKQATANALPKAWNVIINEPDSSLINLIVERTEKLCGFKPDIEEVKEFLVNQYRFPVPSKPILEPVGTKKFGPRFARKRGGAVIKREKPFRIHFDYKGERYEAEFQSSNIIFYNGTEYSSLSALSSKITNTSRNGWRDWKYLDNQGKEQSIDSLRKEVDSQ